MRTSLYAAVQAAAEAGGQRVAVEDYAERISYAGLLERAERVAETLGEAKLTAGSIVGLLFDPSADYVACVLGILRAGHVFLPLNSRFPGQRIGDILEGAGCQICLVSAGYRERLEQLPGGSGRGRCKWSEGFAEGMGGEQARFYLWQSSAAGMRTDVASATGVRRCSADACYVIATSGSTGRPKLILGSEKGLLHFLDWEVSRFGFASDCRVSFLSNVSFDVSLRDMFAPLLAGGVVCIPDDNTRMTPGRLLEWLERKEISHTHIVPTLLRGLFTAVPEQAGQPARMEKLKYALIAGEPLYGYDVRAWRRRVNRSTGLVNVYGPSETTLAKCFYEIGEKDLADNEMVPVGTPLPDTEVLVLRENGQPSPPGEVGEVHIATPFMSLGYLNAPEEESRRFIDNRHLSTVSAVLYRTGDMGLKLASGVVQLHGRKDGQVKLHGNRIELEEIEVALRLHPQVSQAAAAVKRDSLGNDRLVGYVVPKEGESPTTESLRPFLRARLPEYMLPAVFVFLNALPLTHSNKLDRESLPGVPRERPVLEREYRGPENEREAGLAEIWRRLLDIDVVGVEDGFFDLGGTSLLAALLIGRINEELGVDLPATAVFQYPTIRQLARALQACAAHGSGEGQPEQRAEKRRAAMNRRRTARGRV